MPSPAFVSFTVHKFPLASCSAFLGPVASFSIFFTLDCFVHLSLPSACPLSPSIFIAGEHQALWVYNHLSYSTWLLASLPFLSVAWSHSIFLCLMVTVELMPLCWWVPFCLTILSWITLWCSRPIFMSSGHLSHISCCMWWRTWPEAPVQFQWAFLEKIHFYIGYYYSYTHSYKSRDWECGSLLRHLPNMCKALVLIPSNTHTHKHTYLFLKEEGIMGKKTTVVLPNRLTHMT